MKRCGSGSPPRGGDRCRVGWAGGYVTVGGEWYLPGAVAFGSAGEDVTVPSADAGADAGYGRGGYC